MPGPAYRILVVEDDPSSRRALTLLLKLKGFDPSVASSLAEAMKLLETGPAWVLLDLMLPDGNGSAVLQHIRQNRLPIRVAITSGSSNWESQLDSRTRPDAVFNKPLDFNRLLQWLTTA